MSHEDTQTQSQPNPNSEFRQQNINPHRLTKSELYNDRGQAASTLTESIEADGVLQPVLAREEEGQIAVVDGWQRVLRAREAAIDIPIWMPENGEWTDERALKARLFANTTATQHELGWLRRAWLLEDVWEQVGDTRRPSASGVADLLSIPESTARHWLEPVRDAWVGTILDRELYENGQIRDSHGNDNYIISGATIEDITESLGTRKLFDIRTRAESTGSKDWVLYKMVAGDVEPVEFQQAIDIADEDDIGIRPALEKAQSERDTEVETNVAGELAGQVQTVASELGMDEENIISTATERYLEQSNVSSEADYESDSGHLRQQSYIEQQVTRPRPQPALRMESNAQMEDDPTESVHLTVTSPPYNVAWNYGSDQTDNRQYYREYLGELIADTFREVYRLTVEGGYCCIVLPHIYDVDDSDVNTPDGTLIASDVAKVLTGEWTPIQTTSFSRLQSETNWQIENVVTWSKGYHDAGLRNQRRVQTDPLILGPEGPLNNFVEAVLVLKKPGQREVRNDRVKQSGIVWKNDVSDRDLRANIWRIKPESWEPTYSEDSNTAQFPEELAKRCLLHWSYVGDTVLDPFCGRGTTLKMAKQLYRESVGYEVNTELEKDIREYVGLD